TVPSGLADLPELLRAAEGFADVAAALRAGGAGTIDGAWGSSPSLAAAGDCPSDEGVLGGHIVPVRGTPVSDPLRSTPTTARSPSSWNVSVARRPANVLSTFPVGLSAAGATGCLGSRGLP